MILESRMAQPIFTRVITSIIMETMTTVVAAMITVVEAMITVVAVIGAVAVVIMVVVAVIAVVVAVATENLRKNQTHTTYETQTAFN